MVMFHSKLVVYQAGYDVAPLKIDTALDVWANWLQDFATEDGSKNGVAVGGAPPKLLMMFIRHCPPAI